MRLLGVQMPEVAEALTTMDEDAKNAVRRQVKFNATDLQDEWRLLNMMGLEK